MFTKSQHCIIIGASHAGVQAAFSLRKEGWEGKISLLTAPPFSPTIGPPYRNLSCVRIIPMRNTS
ncbi:MAG: FAD/NAD(P)-binding oxidoreductase [Bacteroidota bacterium]